MTTPVTTTAPSPRPSPASDGGRTDSAEPFASALGGALGAAGEEVDGAGAQSGGDPTADQAETPADGTSPADPAAIAPAGVAATLWALLGPTPQAAVGADAAAGSVDGGPPGPAGAGVARAAGGLARGLHGTQPGKLRVEGTPPPQAAPADTVPGTSGPTLPPAAAAARAAAEALAAAGVHQVVTDTAGTEDATGTTAATGAHGPRSAETALPAAGGTARDPGSGNRSGDEGAMGTDAVPLAGSAPPASPTTPVARTEGATGAAVAQPVSGQIARQVAVLRGGPDGTRTMTVVLTPESLGPVEVTVTVSQGAVELTLRGAHEHGRAALLDAVPDLRRDLESAGLTCSRLDVDRGSRDGSWSSSSQHPGRPGEQGAGGRGSQHDRPDGGSRPWHRPADTGEGPRATTRTASGLDVRV